MARRSDRFGATQGLGSILEQEKRRIYDDATPAKREAFLEAERAREVYRAWNTVCARTREGQHVRARMEACGVRVSALVFKLSRKGYEAPRAASSAVNKVKSSPCAGLPRAELSPADVAAIDARVSHIKDDGLQRALKSAMGAGLSLDKTRKSTK